MVLWLKEQKARELGEQLERMEREEEDREQERLELAQEKFLQGHFEERVLGHRGLDWVREGLAKEVALQLTEAQKSAQERRVREVRVRTEGREQRERQELDRAIRETVLEQTGVKERKDALQERKVQLASLKSKYNLKVSTLTRQTQELRQKIVQTRQEDAEMLLEQMER